MININRNVRQKIEQVTYCATVCFAVITISLWVIGNIALIIKQLIK